MGCGPKVGSGCTRIRAGNERVGWRAVSEVCDAEHPIHFRRGGPFSGIPLRDGAVERNVMAGVGIDGALATGRMEEGWRGLLIPRWEKAKESLCGR